MTFFEMFIVFAGMIFGGYVVLWGGAYMFFGIRASYGDSKHIIFMDSQLAKEPNKAYSMLPFEIGFRHHCYSVKFPFIRHRVTTKSKKFHVLMWLHFTWFLSICMVILLTLLAKNLGIDSP